jgi:CAAX protease family protein
VNAARSTASRWTYVGLGIALAAMPLVVGFFNFLHVPWNTRNVVSRELVLLALAGVLALIIRRKERLGWSSVGLGRPKLGSTALWVLITFGGVVAAAALAFGIAALFHWPVGSADSNSYDALPGWVLLLVILRAGFVEEFCYRGYAIERLQALTGSRFVAIGLPLFVFAIAHYKQGWAGITIALFTGAVLSGIYLFKRNLWITICVHFIGDFIPNIVVPLFAGSHSAK